MVIILHLIRRRTNKLEKANAKGEYINEI